MINMDYGEPKDSKKYVSKHLDGNFLWKGVRRVCVPTDNHEICVNLIEGCFMKSEQGFGKRNISFCVSLYMM